MNAYTFPSGLINHVFCNVDSIHLDWEDGQVMRITIIQRIGCWLPKTTHIPKVTILQDLKPQALHH